MTLDELDRLEKEATQGEWSVGHDGPSRPILLGNNQMRSMSAFDGGGSRWGPYDAEDADLEFIAALVNFWRSGGREMVRDGEKLCDSIRKIVAASNKEFAASQTARVARENYTNPEPDEIAYEKARIDLYDAVAAARDLCYTVAARRTSGDERG